MFFYLLFVFCICSLLLTGYFYPNKNNWLQGSVFVLLVCFVGLRDFVGADFDEYVYWYQLKTRDQDFECGFLGLMHVFRFLHLGYTALFFFISFLTYFFLFLGIRKYTINQNLALGIFLLIPGMFLISLNTLRQSLAVSICFFAFYYLIQKKPLVFFALMLLGLSIHNTVLLPLVLFVIAFLFADKIKPSHILILLGVSLVLSRLEFVHFFSSYFKETRYAYYFLTKRDPVDPLKLIALNAVALFVLFHFEKMKTSYPNQKYFMVLYFLSIIITNFFSLYGEMSRFAYYFKIFEIIVIADIIFVVSKEIRVWVLAVFSVYYLSSFVYTLHIDLEKDYKCKLVPYKNVLFQS